MDGVQSNCKCCVCNTLDSPVLGPVDDLLYTFFAQQDNEYGDYLLSQGLSRELLHYKVKAHGVETDVLLDCGATRDYADEQNMQALGFSFTELEEPFDVSLANGVHITCKYVIKRLKLKFKQFSHEADLYVLDLQGQHHIILGQPFLKSRNPDIDWKTGTMTLRKKHRSHDVIVDSITSIEAKRCVPSAPKLDDKVHVLSSAFDLDILAALSDTDHLHEHFCKYDTEYEDAFIDGGEFRKIYKSNLRRQQRERRRKPSRSFNLDGDAFCIWIRDEGDKMLVLGNNGEHLMEFQTGEDPQNFSNDEPVLTDALKEQLTVEVYDKWSSIMKPYPPQGVPPV